jgi:phage FluMu protein gp41
MLGVRLEFLPSAYLQHMFHEVYVLHIDAVQHAQRYLAKRAVRRLAARELNALSQNMRELESRMSVLKMR